jgi:two-component system chemotaxis sensor kinase CheA
MRLDFQERDQVVTCRVSDDGCGIDADELIKRARSKGLLSAEEALAPTPQTALELVLANGLSSANEVSDTWGRGVGMGAVKSAVEALGGRLTIQSDRGRGTVIDLEWPKVS